MQVLFRVFDNIDAGKKSIYNVDVLTAFRWTTEEWNFCPASVIHNCFTNCLHQKEGFGTDMEQRAGNEALESMSRDAQENSVTVTKAGLQNLLNLESENNILEEVNFEEPARKVARLET